MAAEGVSPRIRHALGRLRTPTLVLAGGDDLLTPPTYAAELARAIRGARLSCIPGAGHLVYLESPHQSPPRSWTS